MVESESRHLTANRKLVFIEIFIWNQSWYFWKRYEKWRYLIEDWSNCLGMPWFFSNFKTGPRNCTVTLDYNKFYNISSLFEDSGKWLTWFSHVIMKPIKLFDWEKKYFYEKTFLNIHPLRCLYPIRTAPNQGFWPTKWILIETLVKINLKKH